MKKINIQNEAHIKGIGTHTQKNCKAVICIDTGEVFTSCMDAAEHAGVHFTAMASACLGKTRTCNGKRYCYLSEAAENLNSIVTRLREASSESEDARKWREYQAEQEAVRKEEEKRQAEIAKLEEKLARQRKICENIEAELMRATANLMTTESELNVLKGANHV